MHLYTAHSYRVIYHRHLHGTKASPFSNAGKCGEAPSRLFTANDLKSNLTLPPVKKRELARALWNVLVPSSLSSHVPYSLSRGLGLQ